uniref:AB hydrolase-1 domain-containing protein n=1 Tax=Oryza punctata TaxID=4537 RepID=A0A0E0M9V5_ORYPU
MAAASTGNNGSPPVALLVLMAAAMVAGWFVNAVRPPPPTPCGTEGGPPVTASRVRVRDGRFLAYAESGVSREAALFKVVYSHGFSGGRMDSPRASQELGVYMVAFDRAGYGESDPDPRRSLRSAALDIQDLADALQLGPKFHLICSSLGCHAAWASFKYIPHRLAGAAMMAPVINYRWPGLPRGLARQLYRRLPAGDQWSMRVAYYAPWLLHWWMNQTWLPTSTVISGSGSFPNALDEKNRLMALSSGMFHKKARVATQQGVQESFYRDMAVMFGRWPEFEPAELEEPPFPVHLFQGDEDGVVPVQLQRQICRRLGWVSYHELAGVGHFLSAVPGLGDRIVSTLLPPPA